MFLGKIPLGRLFLIIIGIFGTAFIIITTLNYTELKIGISDSSSFNEITELKQKLKKLEDNLNLNKKYANKLETIIKESIDNSIETVPENRINNKIGVLVISCNRPSVTYHIDQLLKHRKYNEEKFPIVISQDCAHEATKEAILKYKTSLYAFIEQPDQSEIKDLPPNEVQFAGYYKIARHYKWALDKMFIDFKFESVIITEDDLNIAVDFFQYFEKLNELLHKDSSLFCISAWNDNGKRDCIKNDPELLHRTDFFPGLGWMLTRNLWLELKDKWPRGFWDDWLRLNEQRKNRSCIRPEISRTEISSIGKFGTSNGQFYDTYLKYINLNIKPVDWLNKNIDYLIKDNYDRLFLKDLNSSNIQLVTFNEFTANNNQVSSLIKSNKIKIKYSNLNEFSTMANYFGIMKDAKDGILRTAYYGVVRIFKNNLEIFLVPS